MPRFLMPLLAEPLSGSFFAPYATMMLACWTRIPTMMDAFKGSCRSRFVWFSYHFLRFSMVFNGSEGIF